MIKLRIGRNVAEFYSGELKELPMAPYLDHQRFAMMDARIGGLSEFDRHLEVLNKYYKQGDLDNIKKHTDTMRLNLHLVSTNTSPKLMSFVALLKSWNGKEVVMKTDEHVKEWHDRIAKGLKLGVFQQRLSAIKKKFNSRLITISQKSQTIRKYFTSTRSKEKRTT